MFFSGFIFISVIILNSPNSIITTIQRQSVNELWFEKYLFLEVREMLVEIRRGPHLRRVWEPLLEGIISDYSGMNYCSDNCKYFPEVLQRFHQEEYQELFWLIFPEIFHKYIWGIQKLHFNSFNFLPFFCKLFSRIFVYPQRIKNSLCA